MTAPAQPIGLPPIWAGYSTVNAPAFSYPPYYFYSPAASPGFGYNGAFYFGPAASPGFGYNSGYVFRPYQAFSSAPQLPARPAQRDAAITVEKAHTAHPEINGQALREAAVMYRNHPAIINDPAAMDRFTRRMESKYGADGHKAVDALAPKHDKNQPCPPEPYQGDSIGAGLKTSSYRPPYPQANTSLVTPARAAPAPKSAGNMSLLGWLGLAAGGFAGFKMMMAGGGFSATGMVVTAVIAVIGGMLGNTGNYMISSLMTPKTPAPEPEKKPAVGAQRQQTPQAQGNMQDAAEQYRRQQNAPASSGHDYYPEGADPMHNLPPTAAPPRFTPRAPRRP